MADRTHRDFTEDDIKLISETFEAYRDNTLQDVKGFCATKTIDDIAEQDFILTPGRYVGIVEEEDSEPFEEKMKRLSNEINELFEKSRSLEDSIKEQLKAIEYEK